MNLIAFSGGMGVGKSTAIALLKQKHERVHLVKFAQPLYDMQEYIYSRIDSVHSRPESFVKDRKLLQWLGTEWGRDTISTNLWVDIWKAEVKRLYIEDPQALIVCDDCRFDNEATTVKEMGGVVVKLVSDKVKERGIATGIANHASESGINEKLIDYIVTNNDTIEEFKISLGHVYRAINRNK